jgi:hypothetical protein
LAVRSPRTFDYERKGDAMNEPVPAHAPADRTTLEQQPPAPACTPDVVMTAYVGYLAGWFEIGRLAASRRLDRAGLSAPLLNDSC